MLLQRRERATPTAMLALMLAASLTTADLNRWIDQQDQVATYRSMMEKEQALLQQEPNPAGAAHMNHEMACDGAKYALAAADQLNTAANAPTIALFDADLRARNGGKMILQPDANARKLIKERAISFENLAKRHEVDCESL